MKGEPLVSKDFHGGFLPSDLKLHSQTECEIQRGGAVAVVGLSAGHSLAACCRRLRFCRPCNPFRRGSAFVGEQQTRIRQRTDSVFFTKIAGQFAQFPSCLLSSHSVLSSLPLRTGLNARRHSTSNGLRDWRPSNAGHIVPCLSCQPRAKTSKTTVF